MNSTPSVFRDARAILGESLVLDDSGPAPAMLWCDITAGLLHRSVLAGDPGGADDSVLALPAPLASFHRAELGGEPGYVVSLGDRVVLADEGGAIVRDLARIDHAHPGMRLNEGKVDPLGRWVTGSMDLTRGEPDGAFYAIDPDGAVRVIAGGLGTANGLEWSLDDSRVYYTDTSTQTIYTGDYSTGGEIADVEVFHHGEMHDGLTIDADGWLWSAVYGAEPHLGRFRRLDPARGERPREPHRRAAAGASALRCGVRARNRDRREGGAGLRHVVSSSIVIAVFTRARWLRPCGKLPRKASESGSIISA
jgi:sugar lactone lactonase YvrE